MLLLATIQFMVLHLKKKNTKGLLIKDSESIELDVADINQAARFYSRNLGFEVLFTFSDMAILRRPEDEISLVSATGGNHLKVKLASRKEMDDMPIKLKATGVRVLTEPISNEFCSLSFLDADGNQIEVIFQPFMVP